MRTKEQQARYTETQRRKPRGLLARMYQRQVVTSRLRLSEPPVYTFQQLAARYENDPKFLKLFKAWELSGYKYELTPCFDRIDCWKPYTFENLNPMTIAENDCKSFWERKYRNKRNRAVLRLTSEGPERYFSISYAARKTGVPTSTIHRLAHQSKGRVFASG